MITFRCAECTGVVQAGGALPGKSVGAVHRAWSLIAVAHTVMNAWQQVLTPYLNACVNSGCMLSCLSTTLPSWQQTLMGLPTALSRLCITGRQAGQVHLGRGLRNRRKRRHPGRAAGSECHDSMHLPGHHQCSLGNSRCAHTKGTMINRLTYVFIIVPLDHAAQQPPPGYCIWTRHVQHCRC